MIQDWLQRFRCFAEIRAASSKRHSGQVRSAEGTTIKPPLLIFDYDGTLVDSTTWFYSSLNEVADRFGFLRTTEVERQALRGMNTREVLKRLEVPLWRLPSISRYMRRIATRDASSIPVFRGVDEALRLLHGEGVVLALVTSMSMDNVVRTLGEESVSLFKHLSCGSSLMGKGRRIRKATSLLGSERKVAYVGDEIRDIEAAREAGVTAVAVEWGYGLRKALAAAKPDLMLQDIAELRDLGRRLVIDPAG